VPVDWLEHFMTQNNLHSRNLDSDPHHLEYHYF